MHTVELNAQLIEHFRIGGTFSPFTYAIGLEAPFDFVANSTQEYPLKRPLDEDTLRKFMVSLTFYHELAHLAQFISTGYGLRTLRFTIIALAGISKKKGWEYPVLNDIYSKLPNLDEHEKSMLDRGLIFLDAMDQFKVIKFEAENCFQNVQQQVRIDMTPWSPHYFLYPDHNDTKKCIEIAQYLQSIGAHVRKLPYITINQSGVSCQLVLNVAVLMECYAVLVEINHITNAIEMSIDDIISLLPNGSEYHALMMYLVLNDFVDLKMSILTLGVIIDAALMYDPFILFNVPWDVVDKDGRFDQYPGETFYNLCKASKNVRPICGNDPEEVGRFYKDICAAALLPDPDWMAVKSHEVAVKLLYKTDNKNTILGNALKAHVDALSYRVEIGGAKFPFHLPITKYLLDILEIAIPVVSFYNAKTREAEMFDPRKVDSLTVHSLLIQILTERELQCPLKLGVPFFCDSAKKAHNLLCVWLHERGRSECLLDIFERQYGLVPMKD